jgi:hypothetical protein
MRVISRQGIRHIDDETSSLEIAPARERGAFNDMINALFPVAIPIPKGIYRFKTHEAMNRQWDEAMAQIVVRRQSELRAARDSGPER